MKLGEWIQQEMDRKGWSARELARRAKVSSPTISRIISGERGGRADSVMMIAAALGLDSAILQRLLAGEDVVITASPDRTPEEIVAELAAALRRDRERREKEEAERKRAEIEAGLIKPIPGKLLILPVHRQPLSADATLTGYVAEDVAFFDAPTDADPERYQAFYVAGDCLQGRVEPGTTIVVDCLATPRPGDIVAVHNGGLLIKILTEVSDGQYLTTLNGQPPIKMTDEIHIIGVVKKMIVTP